MIGISCSNHLIRATAFVALVLTFSHVPCVAQTSFQANVNAAKQAQRSGNSEYAGRYTHAAILQGNSLGPGYFANTTSFDDKMLLRDLLELCTQLGDQFSSNGKLSSAETMWKDELISEHLLAQDDGNNLVYARHKLAKLYIKEERFADARKIYEQIFSGPVTPQLQGNLAYLASLDEYPALLRVMGAKGEADAFDHSHPHNATSRAINSQLGVLRTIRDALAPISNSH